jgi:hypothetical protein
MGVLKCEQLSLELDQSSIKILKNLDLKIKKLVLRKTNNLFWYITTIVRKIRSSQSNNLT